MGLTLSNILGLWALLGIPALLVIHLIREQHRKILSSTLFLLPEIELGAPRGKQIRQLEPTKQLLLQLLVVILAALILSGPKLQTLPDSQRVVIVIDSSYSMNAFRDRLIKEAPNLLSSINKLATRTEWYIYSSDRRVGLLYRGWELSPILGVLTAFSASTGSIDFDLALQEVASTHGTTTRFYFLTDHPQKIPQTFQTVAYGNPIPNFGILGQRLTESESGLEGEVSIKNFSSVSAKRDWKLLAGQAVLRSGQVELSPGALQTVQVALPENEKSFEFRLEEDSFALDDRLPLVRPVPRKISIFAERGDMSRSFRRLLASIKNSDRSQKEGEADLRIITFSDSEPFAPKGNAIAFFNAERPPEKRLYTGLSSENHGLTDQLRWTPLVAGATSKRVRTENEEVLLWSNETPLVILSKVDSSNILVVNFDTRTGDAFEHPSFVLLLHRFIELSRSQLRVFSAENLFLGSQIPYSASPDVPLRLELLSDKGDSSPSIENNQILRAPTAPAHFFLKENEKLLFQGAASLSDPVESDFRDFPLSTSIPAASRLESSFQDPFNFFLPLVVLLMLILGMMSWKSDRSNSRRSVLSPEKP